MKKFLVAAAAALMLVTTTAPAKAGSDWVGPAILGTIFGVIIANNHGHADVVVERRHRHVHRRQHRHHRHHAWRSSPSYKWVKVCKDWPSTRRDGWGDSHVIFDYECRWVRKAVY